MNALDEMICPSCGERTPTGKFCIHCGTSTRQACPSCGEPVVAGAKFCLECGTALGATQAPTQTPTTHTPVSERRLVSVLFADLVGFTTLSERRDVDEVRDLLSRYFDHCRILIERYGGTVEKFIGDAVMAVWGSPVAREDDAERAVRAALSLTQAISGLGLELGMPELRVRAGVLTGNAAVDVGHEREGMVLGDTVNTASRLQSIAEPGTVLVDDITRRASEAAIAYEDAGTHQLKGREQPVRAWRALRVVAGAGGARRAAGLEAPFVGRDHELQAIIDAGEDSAHDGRARHVAVVGEAGSGKSRLLWEFFKYLDGIEETRYWHQGRCLSYGEGVAYWALAEMVRARARIDEEEDPASAREKLRAAVETHVPDERERRLVEPRLAHLLRLEERPDADRVDLFSGWRLFFERMATTQPVILAFEDLEWADSGLLDFVDYLLEWSADFPILVLSLGRPDLRERRPSWETLSLGPLDPTAIAEMLEGLAPGLPEDLVDDIGRRSEGIPLYAVETVRMLQDRGMLVQDGARYVVTGDVSNLEVPETLQALVASRLDGLASGERSLLQDASVLGKAFTAAASAALAGLPEPEVIALLDGLVGKQILARDDDPRSPERGQYVFMQELLRTVAYGTLSRRARKARHLAAAHHLERAWPGEARDIAEVLASHYLEAIRAEPDADDVPALRASARQTLTAAGRAAASLALGREAQSYFEQAADLADDDLERASLFEQAGRALWQSGEAEAAVERLSTAIDLYQRVDETRGIPAAARLANALRYLGRLDEARSLLERFRDIDETGDGASVRAEAMAELAAVLMFGGAISESQPLLEEALTKLEVDQAWPALVNALITRAVYLLFRHRREEGEGVLRHALVLAERHDLPAVALRARVNLAQVALERDQFAQALHEVEEGLTLARERGDRQSERQLHGQLMPSLFMLGRWDEATRIGDALITGPLDLDAIGAASFLSTVATARGDADMVDRCLAVAANRQDSTYVDQRLAAILIVAQDALERGSSAEALRLAADLASADSVSGEIVETCYAVAVEAAISLGDEHAIGGLEGFVAGMPTARATPLLRAGRARLSAELAHRRDDNRGAAHFEEEAIALLRSVGARPLLARTLLERARRRDDAEALSEARAICDELGATRWLAEIDHASGVAA